MGIAEKTGLSYYKQRLKEKLDEHGYEQYSNLILDLSFHDFYSVYNLLNDSIRKKDFKMVERVLILLSLEASKSKK